MAPEHQLPVDDRITNALMRAVHAAGGSYAALAEAVESQGGPSCTRQAIAQWFQKGVPAERVVAIEHATGGLVTRQELRPDLYR